MSDMKTRGPVESSLRWAAATSKTANELTDRAFYDLGPEAHGVLHGAAVSLDLTGLPIGPLIRDVFSEAIEAAEALRL